MKKPAKQDEEWKAGFREAVLQMCRSGLLFSQELSVEGMLAVTLDKQEVVVVSVNERYEGANEHRCLPTMADDLARKRMIAPLLSKLFGAATDAQSNVLVSGLRNRGDTVGRLVFDSTAPSDKPHAKLVLQTEKLLPTASEVSKPAAATKETSNGKNDKAPASSISQQITQTKTIAMDTTDGVQVTDNAQSVSEVPPTVIPSESTPAQKPAHASPNRQPMDLTTKKSIHKVIAKLQQPSPLTLEKSKPVTGDRNLTDKSTDASENACSIVSKTDVLPSSGQSPSTQGQRQSHNRGIVSSQVGHVGRVVRSTTPKRDGKSQSQAVTAEKIETKPSYIEAVKKTPVERRSPKVRQTGTKLQQSKSEDSNKTQQSEQSVIQNVQTKPLATRTTQSKPVETIVSSMKPAQLTDPRSDTPEPSISLQMEVTESPIKPVPPLQVAAKPVSAESMDFSTPKADTLSSTSSISLKSTTKRKRDTEPGLSYDSNMDTDESDSAGPSMSKRLRPTRQTDKTQAVTDKQSPPLAGDKPRSVRQTDKPQAVTDKQSPPQTGDKPRSAFTAIRRFTSRKALDEMQTTDDPKSSHPQTPPIKTPTALMRSTTRADMKAGDIASKLTPRAVPAAPSAGSHRKRGEGAAKKGNIDDVLSAVAKGTPEAMPYPVSLRRRSVDSGSERSRSPSVTGSDAKKTPVAKDKAALKPELARPVKLQPENPRGFAVEQKLEAEDKGNGLVCVATVADVRMGKLRIHFDGWEDAYDFWCYPWSPIIHEVGWCQENEVPISPPKDWEDIASFTWEKYLALTETKPVPEWAFTVAADLHKKEMREKNKHVQPEHTKVIKRKVLGSKIAAEKQKAVQKAAGRGGGGRASTPAARGKVGEEEDTGRKVVKYCGKCEPCRLQTDCGECAICKDKPKHGGHNTRRSKCLLRRCAVYTMPSPTS